ncbi:hypothetical protein Gpo141_00002393 [Globisporangium polare]
MEELSDVCKHVYEPLVVIYDRMLAMEKKGTLPSDSVIQDYSSLVGEYETFVAKYRGKRWVDRVVTYKRALPRVVASQERVNTLMIALQSRG